mgnify:FL=1
MIIIIIIIKMFVRHGDDLFADSPLPSGLPMCVSLVLWDSLYLNQLSYRDRDNNPNDNDPSSKNRSFSMMLVHVPFIQNPTTSRHRSMNHAFFYWSIICQFHNTNYPLPAVFSPLSVDTLIPLRVSFGVRYALRFHSSKLSSSSSSSSSDPSNVDPIMDLHDIPQGALCKLWFSFTSGYDWNMVAIDTPSKMSALVCHHVEVCSNDPYDALPLYMDSYTSFQYKRLPPLVSEDEMNHYKSIIFAVLRYYKHHSFVFPMDEVFTHSGSKKKRKLDVFDQVDLFKSYFFLPLSHYLEPSSD